MSELVLTKRFDMEEMEDAAGWVDMLNKFAEERADSGHRHGHSHSHDHEHSHDHSHSHDEEHSHRYVAREQEFADEAAGPHCWWLGAWSPEQTQQVEREGLRFGIRSSGLRAKESTASQALYTQPRSRSTLSALQRSSRQNGRGS